MKKKGKTIRATGEPPSQPDPSPTLIDGLSAKHDSLIDATASGRAELDGPLLELIVDRLQDRFNEKIRSVHRIRSTLRQSSSVHQVSIVIESGELKAWVKTLHGPGGPESQKARQTLRDADLTAFLSTTKTSIAFGVPELLLAIPEAGVVVTRHAPGERVQNAFQAIPRATWRSKDLPRLVDISYRCGAWLREFQELTEGFCPAEGTSAEPPHTKDLQSMARQAVSRLTEAHASGSLRFSRDELNQITHNLERLSSHTRDESAFCAVHGDFFAGNLLASTDQITGIDFSSSTFGTPHFDLGYFVYQLQTLFRYKIGPKRVPREITGAFLNGYGLSGSVDRFWTDNPGRRIVWHSLSASRLLSLSHTGGIRRHRLVLRKQYARKIIKELLRP